MSAVSNSVMPRSIALWITLREVSRSVRWPKLLQPRPTAETRRPEPPRLRICMDRSCEGGREAGSHCGPQAPGPQDGEWCGASVLRTTADRTKKCGPGQTRRLTGTAGALDL